MNILDEIVAAKRRELAATRQARPLAVVERAVESAPPVRDFTAALRQHGPVALIAEVKKASPSAGLIRADFDPVDIARIYEANGTACISVLTDEPYFQGKLEYLTQIRAAVDVPVLRKDFILDEYQVFEARAAGADALLLIAECLSDAELGRLYALTKSLGMEALIEIYDAVNVDRVLTVAPRLVGVNNRNLRTMVTDLEHSLRIRERVPKNVVFVSESGIKTPEHVRTLAENGVDAMLVGESLMKQPDIGLAVRTLLSR
jgi:indole-3-glycerol phosphate synthase